MSQQFIRQLYPVGGGEKQHSVLVGWALLFAYYSIIAGAPKQIIEVDPALWQWGGHVTYRILAPSIHHSSGSYDCALTINRGPNVHSPP